MLSQNIRKLTMLVIIDGKKIQLPYILDADVLGGMRKVPQDLPDNVIEVTDLSDPAPTFITI